MNDYYPEWLVDTVAKAIAFSQNPSLEQRWDDDDWEARRNFWRQDAEAVLHALNFMPDYQSFKRANGDRMATDIWVGTAMDPGEKQRRHEALVELFRTDWATEYDS